MLAPHERRLIALLAVWLAAGAALDAIALRRPQTIVPLVGEGRFTDLLRAGEIEPGVSRAPESAPAEATAAAESGVSGAVAGRRVPAGKPRRGRPLAYDSLGRLNLNLADSTELELLTGVGPALAGRILAERARRGGFRRPDDLLRVRGIGPRTLAKILPQLTVRAAGDSLARSPRRPGRSP